MRQAILPALAVIALAGCLLPPELDTPLLQEDLSTEASDSSTCKGVYTGSLPDLNGPFEGQCTVNGSIDLAAITDSRTLLLIKKVRTVHGAVVVQGPLDLAKLMPHLTEADALTLSGVTATTYTGPAQLTKVGGLWFINSGCTTLLGFAGLAKIGSLAVGGNPSLVTIKAFENLKEAKDLGFHAMASLKALPTFAKLTTVTGEINITNLGVEDITFPALTSAFSLVVNHCKSLKTLNAPKLATLSNLEVEDDEQLLALDGLSAVTVTKRVSVCHIAQPGADRQKWLEAHAPGLQFPNCGDGCYGWGTCAKP